MSVCIKPKYLGLGEIRDGVLNDKFTMPDLVKYYLGQAKEYKRLNAFLETFDEEALKRAEEIQKKIKEGKGKRLAGLVISIKDNMCYKGHKVSAASKIIENYESPFSATVVERILAEDAIIIGRTNCDEFAMGMSNENSAFGDCLNMVDETRVPGGSSGGCAVSLQADMCLASLGTDTGGSVRQPASFCGLIGLRPTYGRISRWGIIAYASSLDQVGIFAHNIEMMADLLEIIAGPDDLDSTCTQHPLDDYAKLSAEGKPKKIAYIGDIAHHEGLDEDVKEAFFNFIDELKSQGHTVDTVSFPLLEYLVPTYYILTSAEASSNLARYDGIHYGRRAEDFDSLKDLYEKSRSEGFGPEVKRRILLGTFVLSAGYYDAFYSKAQKTRRLIREATLKILDDYDFILTPTAPTPALKLGNRENDVAQNFLADIFTVQSALAGIPSISLPTHTSKEGLPIGMQLMGKPFGEHELLQVSKSILDKMNVSC